MIEWIRRFLASPVTFGDLLGFAAAYAMLVALLNLTHWALDAIERRRGR